MVPSGPSTPIGGTQSVPASHLRSNSSLMGGGAQPNSIQSQPPFSSLVSPRTQFNSTNNLLANISNVSSLLNHSFQNGGSNVSVSSMLGNAGIDPMNPNGNQLGLDHRQNQQLDPVSNFQQQFQVQQQRGGMGPVKLEQHQLQAMRSLGPVKMEPQHSDTSIFLQQQQHQQQLVQLSRQSSQAAAAAQMNLLQQQQQQQLQRILKQQQQQQQQQLILKSLPQQRGQLQQQHLHQQSVPVRTPQAKPAAYEPGTCARRLTHYMYHQKHKPADNNIEFWRKFVAEYFAPNAKKRWCVSLYGNGRQTTGVFPQDIWHCEICNRKPGRGFETTVEVLPRLCQIKYASGTLEELLYVDMPREYQNASGQIVLDYAKAIQESVFELLRVVRDGQLRIVFNQDLKIASWEFCARRHEELIPRRLIIPQISQLGAVVHKYQAAAQNSSSSLSTQDLQNTCSSFVSSARQLAKALEVPLVNDLGYTKRYVRCLQISEVVNSMKDLIDYSRETGTGPMDSLINFSRRSSSSSSWAQHKQPQQPEEHQQQSIYHNSNQNSPGSARATNTQLVSISNAITSINNSVNAPSSSTSSTVTMAALLHQNSMNSQHDNQMGPTNIQIPSASSSNAVPSPTPSLSNNNLNTNESDPNDSQSSVQQILQEMLMSSQLNEMKGLNGSNFLGFGNGISNSMGGFGAIGRISPSAATSGMRAAMAMNHMSRDPMVLNHQQQQQSMGNRMLGGLGAVNNFSNLHFDWKLP